MKKIPFVLILTSLFFTACTKDTAVDDPLNFEKKYLFSIMNDIYYWYKDVPQNIDRSGITTLNAYFDTLLVPHDRWSWMMNGEEYQSMETGQYKIYGASFSQPIDYYNDYSVRVRYVFDNSPMSENGVKRGYELTHLNGKTVSELISNGTINSVLAQESNVFTFKSASGESFSFSANARLVSTRSVLKSLVFTSNDFPGLPYNVGYLNYYTFNDNMISDLDNAFATFKNANVKELILDLRYNGGGDGGAMSYIANLLGNEATESQILSKRKHNDKNASAYDNTASATTYIHRSASSLDVNRIFILSTKATASASEVLINGLRPLMNIVQVGSVTYGKPYGMYVIPYPQNNYTNPSYVFLPICFLTVNKNGVADYENGLTPDHLRPDDLYHDFGVEEDWIKACLTYIKTGAFSSLPAKVYAPLTIPGGIFIKEEDKTDYGKLIYRR
jgi:C-terminal processing protease CtpA/Prc